MGAFVGNIFLERGDGGSPEAFTRICDAFTVSGVGVNKEQVESTTFCSGGSKEFISGLKEGSEISAELNYRTDAAIIETLMADAEADDNVTLRLAADGNGDGAIDKYFTFAATPLSYVLNPNVSSRNTVTFGWKISGAIVRTDGP